MSTTMAGEVSSGRGTWLPVSKQDRGSLGNTGDLLGKVWRGSRKACTWRARWAGAAYREAECQALLGGRGRQRPGLHPWASRMPTLSAREALEGQLDSPV